VEGGGGSGVNGSTLEVGGWRAAGDEVSMGWDGVSGVVVVVARCWTGPCFRSQTELFRDLSRQQPAKSKSNRAPMRYQGSGGLSRTTTLQPEQ
jgi:hypothetical protein